MLENALSSGMLTMGVDVLFIGPLPTPGVAYVTRSLRADAGIVITASHNPYDDNGIKFFHADGYKLDDEIENRIEQLVFSGEIEKIRPTAREIGKAVRIDDALGRYIEFAKSTFPRNLTLDGLRIVVDCAHGAAYKSTPCVLRELGAQVFVHGNEPDGVNINKDCGAMHPEHFCRLTREHKAHAGLAHDGDADRVLLCDEKGALIDGDDIMAILALEQLAAGTLAKKTLAATVMSNAGLDAAIAAAGGKTIRAGVGDQNVLAAMRKEHLNLGGEQSGHIIMRDFSTTGDGLIAALQILRVMKMRNKPLSELARCWTRWPQLLTNIVVREKKPLEQLGGRFPAGGRGRGATQAPRGPGPAPLFRHRAQSAPAPGRPRRRRAGTMESEDFPKSQRRTGVTDQGVKQHLTLAAGYGHFGHVLNHQAGGGWGFTTKMTTSS